MTSSFLNILFNKELSEKDRIALLQKEVLESTLDESLDSDTYERDRFVLGEQCRMEYGDEIWNKLSTQSQKDLKLAYFYEKFITKIHDDESTPISKFTKTVENEIRQKLFIEYAKMFKDERLKIGDKSDSIFDEFLNSYLRDNKASITLGQMLTMISKSSNNRTKSNYSYELKSYIIDNNWDEVKFYSAKRKNFYIDYPNRFRNDASHEYVYDSLITKECKVVSKEIITWFIGSMK